MSLKFNSERNLYLPHTKGDKVRNNPISLSEVPQTPGAEGQQLSLDNLGEIIEEPLIEAVRILMFKNIETITSTANGENGVGDYAYLGINFSKLSMPNKVIAESLVKKGFAEISKNYRDAGTDVLSFILKDRTGIPLAFNKAQDYYINIADKFIVQKKHHLELPINEIDLYLSQLLGFATVEEMRNDLTQAKIKEFTEEIKNKFDWTENPFVGKKK